MDNLGAGEAEACLDGKCLAATWEKTDNSSRSRFFYDGGQEVEFNAGTTWIEVVKDKNLVNYK